MIVFDVFMWDCDLHDDCRVYYVADDSSAIELYNHIFGEDKKEQYYGWYYIFSSVVIS